MKTSIHFLGCTTALSVMLAVCSVARAATITWSGADSATTTNWSDGLNWLGNIAPGTSDTALFSTNNMSASPGSFSIDNIVSASTTVASLMYAPTNGFRNTRIAPGVMLTISNTTVTSSLLSGTQTDAGGDATVYNTISGPGGTLVINSTNGGSAILVQQSSGTAGTHRSTVDLSELDTFNATVGRILIAVQGPLNAAAGQVSIPNTVRPAGTLLLAKTNIIRTTQTGLILGGQDGGNGSGQGGAASISGPAIVLGDGASNGGQGVMQLGQTNAIFTDTICVSRQKSIATSLSFNPAFVSPSLYLRGATSNRVMRLAVADDGNLSTSTTGASAVIGTVDLSGGISDAMIDTLVIANGQTGNGTAPITGTFTLGAGLLDVNTVNIGYQNAANAAEVTQGTLNITSSGSLIVNNQLLLGRSLGGSVVPQGTLNVNGGAVTTVNGILDQSGAASSTITLTGGAITAGTIGTPSGPIGNFSIGDSRLNLAVNSSASPVVTLNLTTTSTSNNTINVTAISPIAGLASKITLIQSATPLVGSFDFVLGTLPAGYAGTLQTNANNTEVQLVLTSSPFVANNWTGADVIANNITNWSDGLNWSASAPPSSSSPAFFKTTGSVSASALSAPGGGPGAVIPSRINNIVNSNFNILALTYANTNGAYHNTSVSNGLTLNLSLGGLTVGSADTDFGNTTGNTTISGSGALTINNSNSVVFVGMGNASPASTAKASLDMSALSTFNASVGNFLVGVGGNSSGLGGVLQSVGVVYLAQTNLITASSTGSGANDFTQVALEVGDAGDAQTAVGFNNGLPSALYLGQTNAIFADYITVGRQWGNGGIFFNPAFANSTAYFRGANANAVTSWNIGDGVQNTLSAGGGSGTNDFTGGTVNAVVTTMNIAKSSPASTTGSSAVTGTLTFNTGTITANTLNVSYNPAASDLSGNIYDYSVGTVNVNGTGALTVNSTLNLGATVGTPAGGLPTATLNINSGSVLANQIVPGTNSAVSSININSGSLTISNGIGAATPLTSLNITNATLALAATPAAAINVANVIVDGSSSTTNKLNILSVPGIEVYPVTFTLIQSASPISFAGGVFNFKAVLPAASPSFTATISTNPAGTAVLLTVTGGPVTIRSNVFWVGPDGANINWSDGANWLLPPVPGALNTAFFNSTGMTNAAGAGSVDNIVDVNLTVAGLTYAETNGFHNTVINSGVTLTVSNTTPAIALLSGTQTDAGAAAQNYNSLSGTGTLVINNTNVGSAIVVQQCSANSGTPQHLSTLDLSGLNRFNATVGRLLVGVQGFTNTTGQVPLPNITRPSGLLILAKTNIIHTTQPGAIQGPIDVANGNGSGSASIAGPAIVISDAAGTPQLDIVQLGQTNAIFTDSITIGRQKAIATLMFNPTLISPSLYLRGSSANRVATFYVTDDSHVSTSTTAASGTNDWSGGTADAMIDTLVISKGESGNGAATVIGVFNMGAGTLDVNTLFVGQCAVANAGGNVIGLLNVNGGNLVVNNQLVLGQWLGAPSLQTRPTGILNVRSGTVSANTILSGGGVTNVITLTNATLSLTSIGGSIGTVASPINTIAITNSTLNLAVGAFPSVVTSNLVTSGTANTISITALPLVGSVPATNTLIQSVKPIVGAFNFVLGSLPAGYSGILQTNASYTAIQLVLTGAPFPTTGATITSVSQSGSDVIISGTNGLANSVYYVLTSTNVALPRTNWTAIATNTFNGSGNFTATLPFVGSDMQRFYVIQSQ